MPTPSRLALPVALLVAFSGPALAEELSPEKLARVQLAEKKAAERVAKEFGDRPSSAMTSAERRAFIEKQSAALAEVHAKEGVEPKDYARRVARLGMEERREVAREAAQLEAEEKARAAAAGEEKKDTAKDGETVEIYEGLDESQLEQLDEPLPEDGQVQILLPGGDSAESTPEPAPEE